MPHAFVDTQLSGAPRVSLGREQESTGEPLLLAQTPREEHHRHYYTDIESERGKRAENSNTCPDVWALGAKSPDVWGAQVIGCMAVFSGRAAQPGLPMRQGQRGERSPHRTGVLC